MDLNDMPAGELLTQAAAAGLTVSVDDGRLVVRGPREAEGLGRLLIARKADILPLLTADAGRSEAAGAWDAPRADAALADATARLDKALARDADTPARRTVVEVYRE